MDELYDLILVGIDAEVVDRQATVSSIAEFLGMDEAKIGHVVNNNLKAIVKQGIFLEDARNYQQQILRRGGFSNYRPARQNIAKFELEPMEVDEDGLVFVCPACNYREKPATQAELPINCPQCGIIPSKFNKAAAIKYERELIKRRLLIRHQLLGQQAQDLADRREQDARRQKLEEEIRKELGLPQIINSRLRLFGSAALFCVLGIGMGIVGVTLYFQMPAPGDDWSVAEGVGANKPARSSSPQQETLLQISALSQVSSSIETETIPLPGGIPQIGLGGTNPLIAMQQTATVQSEASSAAWANGQSKPARMNGKALLTEMQFDREWDLFLASDAERFAKLKQPAKASGMVEAINSTQLKMSGFGILAGYYAATENQSEAGHIFDMATATIGGLQEVTERVDSLGWWSTVLWRIGEKDKARQNLDAGLKLVSALTVASEKAMGLANLAAHQTQIGQRLPAEANFRQANLLIPSVSDPSTKLHIYTHLASCYAQSGDKAVATAILIKSLNNVKRIKDKGDQQRLVGEIAMKFAEIGEADYALATLDRLNPQSKEKMLFNVTRELAYTGQPYDAMKGLDKLGTPEYQSRAAALLSQVFRYRPGLQFVAPSLQDKASAAQSQIANPQDQAVVRAELARYLAHAGLGQEADEWAKKAIASAQTINNGQERDTSFALLAANFARAKQTTQADASVAQIKDAEFAEKTGKEIANINQLFNGH